ncbi:MAG: hypothetical protein R3C56_35695 [Pirellulaceae bacterium]
MVIKNKLEKHYKDMQDIEFTIEKEPFMLQTSQWQAYRHGGGSLACEMVKEGLIDEKTASCCACRWRFDSIVAPQLPDGCVGKSKEDRPRSASFAWCGCRQARLHG